MAHEMAKSNIRTAVAKLHDMDRVAMPPATAEDLASLRRLCPELPPDVELLYTYVGETTGGIGAFFDLMSIADVIELFGAKIESENQSLRGDMVNPRVMLPIFSDGSGNYAGVFSGGPLRGRCFIHDHEETYNLPVFQNLGRMILAFASMHGAVDKSLQDIPSDYPVFDDAALLDGDEELSRFFLDQYVEDTTKENHSAFLCMQLSPASDTQLLLWMLEQDDIWVQERACELIGLRRFVDGIDAIVEVAMNAKSNPAIATLSVLREWDHPKAKRGLQLLKEGLPDGYSVYWT